MRKILLALAMTFLLGKAMSQGIYQPVTPTAYGSNNLRGVFRTALLIPSGCGVPGAMSLYSVDSSRFALYGDTCANKLYFYNPRTRQWLLSGQTSIPWDSVSGKPVNFPTTYALSNDVQDSIQNRVPYENATRSVNLGNYRLNARGLLMDSLWARNSGGSVAVTNSGTRSFSWGAGGSSEVTFYGFAGMDYNRSGSMTSTSFTPKIYVDSLAALRLLKADSLSGGYTSWLLTKKKVDSLGAVKLGVGDSATYFNNVVRTFGTQTIGGNKTFSNDIFASTARIGIGAGDNASNAVLGYNVFTANTTGTKNTAIGENSLSSNISATDNTALGWYSLDAATGSGNTGIGSGALGTNTSGTNNTALGFGAGEYITGTNPNSTGTNSIYIGYNTKAAANGETNQTVIGHNLTGNGSNTVTIGNSSVTDNYFTGNIRGGAFIRSGGISSQFLKADGSVDGTSYAKAASISGTTNYIPKFTSSSAIGNSIMQELGGRVSVESTNISPFLLNSTGTNGGFITIQKSGTDLGILGASEAISTSANKFDISARTGKGLAFYTNASSTAAIDINTSNAVTLSGALSGTSLSMSGGGSFGGNVGIGTASPSVNLHVQSTQASMNLRSTTTSSPFIDFYTSTSSLVANIYAIDGGGLAFGTASGTERMRLANIGNLGLGVTPKTWFYSRRAIESFGGGAFAGVNAGWMEIWGNSYLDNAGTSRYLQNGFASLYQNGNTTSGGHTWWTAASGTANTEISFTQSMILTPSSELLINTTTTDGTNKLIVNGGVKGARAILNNSTQSQMEAWGWSNIQGASSATGELRIGGIEALQGRIVYASAGNTTLYIENTFDDANAEIKFRTRVAGTAVTPLTLTSTAATFTGAATFSSSVTATGGSFISSGYTLEAGSAGATQKVRIGVNPTGYSSIQGTNIANTATNLTLNPDGGNIGIGITVPTFPLSVAGIISSYVAGGLVRTSPSDAAGMLHIRPNQYQDGYITFTENEVADRWAIGVTGGDSRFFFRPATPTSSVAVYITVAGNICANALEIDESGVRSWAITKESGSLRFASSDLIGTFRFANTTASTSTTTGAVRIDGGLGIAGAVFAGGNITATGFIVSSDLRYKDIISQDGDLYSYTLKADPTKQIHYGYIAQEVEKTLPFAVTTNENGYKSVNYTEVHAIKIRELEKRIEQLEKLLNK